MIAAIQEP